MSLEKLQDAVGEIRDDLIADADVRPARRKIHSGRLAVAACLLIAVFAFSLPLLRTADSAPRQWSETMTAKEYFKNSGKKGSSQASSSSASLVMPPFAAELSLSDRRALFEEEGVIPPLTDHPEEDFRAEFNGDGSLYKLCFWWMRRGEKGAEGYSDLVYTAAPREIHEISDVIYVRTGEDGEPLPPFVTATERDGILILGEGAENETKTLSWQDGRGWHQIRGSFGDSYEDLVSLLDWFWEHPLDLERFEALATECVIFSSRAEHPDAFRGCVPDFEALGYTVLSEVLNLGKRWGETVPVWFCGSYEKDGIRARWTVSAGADADAFADCLGRPAEITEEKLAGALKDKNYINIFLDRNVPAPCMATLVLEQGDIADALEIIRSLH